MLVCVCKPETKVIENKLTKKNLFANIVRNVTQPWLPANSMMLRFLPRIQAVFWLHSFWTFMDVVSV